MIYLVWSLSLSTANHKKKSPRSLLWHEGRNILKDSSLRSRLINIISITRRASVSTSRLSKFLRTSSLIFFWQCNSPLITYPLPNTIHTPLYLLSPLTISPKRSAIVSITSMTPRYPVNKLAQRSESYPALTLSSPALRLQDIQQPRFTTPLKTSTVPELMYLFRFVKPIRLVNPLHSSTILASTLPDGVSEEGAKAQHETSTVVHLGQTGWLRASHQAVDYTLSMEFWPNEPHLKEATQPVQMVEVVELKAGVWRTGIFFKAGKSSYSKHPVILCIWQILRD